jgi:hypothetical protein
MTCTHDWQLAFWRMVEPEYIRCSACAEVKTFKNFEAAKHFMENSDGKPCTGTRSSQVASR